MTTIEPDDEPAFDAVLLTYSKDDPHTIAKNSWDTALSLVSQVENNQSLNPEIDLWTALSMLVKVFWVQTEQRITIANIMHQIGIFLAKNHGCQLKFKDGHYYTDCPNMLLHNDFGFSLRGFEKYKCSICGMDPIDCEHRSGEKYNEIECKALDGLCNICIKSIDNCEHICGIKYDNVDAVKIVFDLEIITFDLVKNPEFVFSRITRIPYSKKYITSKLSNDANWNNFEYGKSIIDCHHCVDCKGYDPEENRNIFSNTLL